MPSDIYGALADFVASQIAALQGVWVAEEPEKVLLPFSVLEDLGFTTLWSFEGEYVDEGKVRFHIFATSADQARNLAQTLKALFGGPIMPVVPTDGTFAFIEVTRTDFKIGIEADIQQQGSRVTDFYVDFLVRAEGNYTTTPSITSIAVSYA